MSAAHLSEAARGGRAARAGGGAQLRAELRPTLQERVPLVKPDNADLEVPFSPGLASRERREHKRGLVWWRKTECGRALQLLALHCARARAPPQP